MPTARFSPSSATPHPPGPVGALRLVVAFRLRTTVRGRRRRWAVGGALLLAVLVAALSLVAVATAPDDSDLAASVPDIAAALPVAFPAFLLTVTVAAIAAGGGREVVPADQTRALPIGATTDHLAALLLAAVSIAWVVPAWGLAAGVVLVSDTHPLAALVVVAVWTVTATAVSQLVGWVVEGWRRLPHGHVAVRVGLGVAAVGLVTLVLTAGGTALGRAAGGTLLTDAARAGDEGRWGTWLLGLITIAAVGVLAAVAGAKAAAVAAERPLRVEGVRETRRYRRRRPARTTWGLLVRLDRAGVWRSAPLRRGGLLLATLPVLVTFVGVSDWAVVPILPGMVAVGGALLFGVNAWCLDAGGVWWRESLPVSPRLVLLARGAVVFELVLGCGLATLVLAALRTGPPPGAAPAVAGVVSTLVVSVRVLATSLSWSVRRPYAADLRRPRATPAPSATMLQYSFRLAVGASVTGLVFALLGATAPWWWSVLVGLVLLATSVASLWRTTRRWEQATTRATVVETVASI